MKKTILNRKLLFTLLSIMISAFSLSAQCNSEIIVNENSITVTNIEEAAHVISIKDANGKEIERSGRFYLVGQLKNTFSLSPGNYSVKVEVWGVVSGIFSKVCNFTQNITIGSNNTTVIEEIVEEEITEVVSPEAPEVEVAPEEELEVVSNLKYFPNPFRNRLRVSFNAETSSRVSIKY